MNYLCTVDPGARYAAWALWDGGGALLACGQTTEAVGGLTCVRVATRLDADVVAAWTGHRMRNKEAPNLVKSVLLVELPERYDEDDETREKDLLRVAATGGAVAGVFTHAGWVAASTSPAKWKGQLPKTVHHQRVREVFQRSPRGPLERWVLETCLAVHNAKNHHNILDAVAMGLWFNRRTR